MGVGALAAVACGAIFLWWAWRDGGYFPVVWYPGALALAALALLLIAWAPWRGSLRGLPGIVLGALAALAAWTLLSATWSPEPDVAFEDGARVWAYGVIFGLGLWCCHLLGRRMLASLGAVAAAGGLLAAATTATIGLWPDAESHLQFGTLQLPAGYRNANAALFTILFWPALALAAHAGLDWRARGLSMAAAVATLELAILCQSRGWMIAIALSTVVFLVVARPRIRSASHLAGAALAALLALPALLAVYNAGDDPGAPESAMRIAAAAIVVTVAAAGALTALAARRRWGPSRALPRPARRALAVATGLAAVALIVALAPARPTEWTEDRYQEFKKGGSPALQGSRFAAHAGSNRYDFWRVAVDEAVASPLTGTGAGGYAFAYLRERRSHEQVRDPHSVQMSMLGELGVIGLALFACLAVAALAGPVRSARLGPSAATASTAAIASGAYWLVHSSVDWIWPFMAIGGPVLFLLGAAAAPALLSPQRAPLGPGWRLGIAAGVASVAVALVPAYLSLRYIEDAERSARHAPEQAREDLRRARTLNPLSDLPLLREGLIARRTGQSERALSAFRRAVERKPQSPIGRYWLGIQMRDAGDPAAIRQLRLALRLNPDSARVRRALETAQRE